MKGLMVWAHGRCRATMAFYEGLANAFGVPLRVVCCFGGVSPRNMLGFIEDEFPHVLSRVVGADVGAANAEYETHKEWHHLFGTYQKGNVFRNILLRVRREGGHAAIMSEAPCVMCPPPGAIFHKVYISFLLRMVVRKQIRSAEFILNCSGDNNMSLRRLCWPDHKIISCGYYPPPLAGSRFVERSQPQCGTKVTFLMTGLPEWHRNPFLLLKAMRFLKDKHLPVRAIVTQDGPAMADMVKYASDNKLDVEFPGRVPLAKLIDLYQTCSCFVATGRAEPWGMRVNDALHCGAPLIVSTGMGAVKLINDYGCGIAFKNNDEIDLAKKLMSLISDGPLYMDISRRVKHASYSASPHRAALRYASEIRCRFPSWC